MFTSQVTTGSIILDKSYLPLKSEATGGFLGILNLMSLDEIDVH
jgi:hypothetical protein